jgi:hypothetical protein
MSDERRVMPPTPATPTHQEEPPVVARLIVEIRSDGSRTIARGAIEDTTTGQRTSIEAHGSTPLALIASLTRSIFQLPAMARQAARALLPGKRPGDFGARGQTPPAPPGPAPAPPRRPPG